MTRTTTVPTPYLLYMTPFARFDAYVRAHAAEYVGELKELVRLPTVSAHGGAIEETAAFVLARARRAGVAAEAHRIEGGPPTIVGEAGGFERHGMAQALRERGSALRRLGGQAHGGGRVEHPEAALA
ncbi:MAG: hypothetical protein AAB295_05675, partial [Chloroflexota bacterium]